ncbi:MAG TPA: YkvA family protein [Methanosarcinales archaeon]|nr:YkvA family protein [Methanosarcinales archaeon]
MLERLKAKAKEIKHELTALYLAYRHPEVPWYSKLFTAIVIGYALSPIDLIPDFIPILGYLDDLILIPMVIKIALKMIPNHVMIECREQAVELDKRFLGSSWIAAVVILVIWVLIAWGIISSIL